MAPSSGDAPSVDAPSVAPVSVASALSEVASGPDGTSSFSALADVSAGPFAAGVKDGWLTTPFVCHGDPVPFEDAPGPGSGSTGLIWGVSSTIAHLVSPPSVERGSARTRNGGPAGGRDRIAGGAARQRVKCARREPSAGPRRRGLGGQAVEPQRVELGL